MGAPRQATPADRLATRAVCAAVIKSVEEDAPMLPDLDDSGDGHNTYDRSDVEDLVAQLAAEVVALQCELDEACEIADHFDEGYDHKSHDCSARERLTALRSIGSLIGQTRGG